MHPWTLYALEISRDRERDFDSDRLVHAAHEADDDRSFVRRPMAVALAALSRGSAAAARRLDECVADDLGRSFATTK